LSDENIEPGTASIRMIHTVARAVNTYPVINPVNASPAPFNDPSRRICPRARCPQMIPAMLVNGARQNNSPHTSDAIASPEVFPDADATGTGARAGPGTGRGDCELA
jgi:hypothetical protein